MNIIIHYSTLSNTIIIINHYIMVPVCVTPSVIPYKFHPDISKVSKVLLVREALPVDGHPASAVATGRVSTLNHEARDDTLRTGRAGWLSCTIGYHWMLILVTNNMKIYERYVLDEIR